MPFGSWEVPKPGCDGAMTWPPLASAVSTGAAGSMPMPGWRNRIGRPEPRSTASMVTPFTTSDLIASGMREPLCYCLAFHCTSAGGVSRSCRNARSTERNIGMDTAEKLGEFETRPGVTYATHDSVALAGDLYLPKGTGPFPALVGVHGGGWVQGARGQFQHWGKYLAARGVALFAISYRFATAKQKTFPHAVQDVLAAIQFVRGNAKEFNIAPDRIGVFGHSAGGNLGALAALGGKSPLFANGYPQDKFASVSTDVKVFAGVYGVYDLVDMWQAYNRQSPENNIEKFLGA